MIFQLVRGATRVAGKAISNAPAVDAQDAKPLPVGPFAVAISVGILVLIVGLSMANGGQVVSVITPLSIVIGLVLLGGLFATCLKGAQGTRANLDKIPDIPTPRQETAELRRAVQQRSSVAVLDRPLTLAQIQAEADLDARMVRMAQILIAECPTCTAGEATFCTFQPGQRVTILDRERGIIVHDARIGNALKTHTAKLEDVNAQFEGQIPDSVWSAAL